MSAPFSRVAILGTGLIGGSFGLALRKYVPDAYVIGWDKNEVLRRAAECGAIQHCATDLAQAVSGADLVYIALPVGHTIEVLPHVARAASPHALITDASSTKRSVCKAASEFFSLRGARFLGGHPMAGKEISGIDSAVADLFFGAKYALIRETSDSSSGPEDWRIEEFVALVQMVGATPVWLNAETHDRAAAIVSHLPQLLAVALAGVVRDQTDETGLPITLAGRGLRDALRLAGSPYSIWRDIILTNSDNLDRALNLVIQSLENLRGELRSRALEEDFAAAGELYKILRDLQ